MRIAVGDDAHHLGVAGLLLGQVLDALTRAYALRDSGGGGVDAVGWGLLCCSIIGFVQKVGVCLLFDCSVDREIAQFIVSIVDVDLA